jgi:glycosyltransferase involved in cell wall biosynthesis
MATPCVSVLMPVFNGEPYLAEAIESILHQTFRDYELIIINDGSTDGSAAIIERYRRADSRIRAYDQSNCGLAATLNRGLGLARGEYIARMDQDDISLNGRLAAQVAFMTAHREVGICGAWVETFDPSRRTVLQLPAENALIRSWLLFESVLPHPSVVMRRKVLSKAGLFYDESCMHAEDYDLWVRASRCTALANVPQVLLRYRLHPSQIVRKYESEKLASARHIRHSQLEYLGIIPTEQELSLHQALSTWQLESEPDFIEATHAWLVKLKTVNEVTGIYVPWAFSRVLGHRWVAVCTKATHLGLWTARKLWRSPLRTGSALTAKDFVKLSVKCMIRQRQHG